MLSGYATCAGTFEGGFATVPLSRTEGSGRPTSRRDCPRWNGTASQDGRTGRRPPGNPSPNVLSGTAVFLREETRHRCQPADGGQPAVSRFTPASVKLHGQGRQGKPAPPSVPQADDGLAAATRHPACSPPCPGLSPKPSVHDAHCPPAPLPRPRHGSEREARKPQARHPTPDTGRPCRNRRKRNNAS